jgi:hypothetical protein
MITSKSAVGRDGDGSCADIANTIERNAPAQRQFCFISIDRIEHPAWRKSQRKVWSARTRPRFQKRRHVAALQKQISRL